ncbi:M16 family metallopeptidase [Magnetococcus sp. PR-3]|uniref:M16 family metallopeptidase n=1 Tax=Magnetococcus sp. PR-3 TaxID=3120355 RepID=UPI002FCE3780
MKNHVVLNVFRLWLFLGLFYSAPLMAAPEVTRVVLPNGFTGVLVESHSNPMVEVRLFIRAGSVMDPVGQEGTAYLLGWLMNEGAGVRNTAQFQQTMDDYGISLSGSASRDYLKVTMRALSKDLDIAFELLGDAITQPRLDDEPIARAKREMMASYEQSREDADVLADEKLEALLMGGHPYARDVSGNSKSIPALTKEGLKVFHQKAMRGPNMVLSVAGDMQPEQFMALIRRHFGKLSHQPGPFGQSVEMLVPPKTESVSGYHIPKDKAQSVIAMGWLGPNRHHADYFAVTVLDHILGGSGFGSRLTEQLREKHGLTYSVYSYFSPWEGRGPWQVGMATKPENVETAVTLIKEILAELAQKGVGQEELTRAKENLLGGFPIALDRLGKMAATWGLIGFYNRGWDYLDRWPERIKQVSREDIQRVAKQFFQTEHMRVVTVGTTEP